MKKHLISILLLSLAVGMVSCYAHREADNATSSFDPADSADTQQDKDVVADTVRDFEQLLTESDIVSPLSIVDYLDFDTSSYPREHLPRYVVIHFVSAVVLDKADPFNREKVRGIFEGGEIGIHYVIERDGTVLCWLPEERAAWHAGKGVIPVEPAYTNVLNKYSIGIEMMAIGSQADMSHYLTAAEYAALNPLFYGYTDEQYDALAALVSDICGRWGIPCERDYIIGHEEYSANKSDPGELFDWDKLMTMVQKRANA